jgi:signal transduction histidine kinase
VVDRLNDISYSYHYRNLDSTCYYARMAYKASDDYESGRSEALNNLAFVNIIRMNFDAAENQLNEIINTSDNQVEQLIADVQMMRICQRQSENKNFYDYREHALKRLRRINEERTTLTQREKKRVLYAESDLHIITSTYYYYIGLERQSRMAISKININGDILNDTAQTLNYLYMVGSGGVLTDKNKVDLYQNEFNYLMRCLIRSSNSGYDYWAANSRQAIAEHFTDNEMRHLLIENNKADLIFVNPALLPDSMLTIWLADKALDTFIKYGDVYQIAASYRTVAQCYMAEHNYRAAINNLQRALDSSELIYQSPDLIATIYEQMCIAYSALGMKNESDYYRNSYLDMQESTRQDRQYEARADELNKESEQLNIMMFGIIGAILLLVFGISLFNKKNRKLNKNNDFAQLLMPLEEWQRKNEGIVAKRNEMMDGINEKRSINVLHIEDNKRRNEEQRAKINLVNTIIPLIDRIIYAAHKSLNNHEDSKEKENQIAYISEITDKINEYNSVLTDWIQMRQGALSLKVETFALNEIFSVVKKGKTTFKLKGITLNVEDTDLNVKADRILTLFMINTLADNARKFTDSGGSVSIYARVKKSDSHQTESVPEGYVEISVEDTGKGLTHDELNNIFNHKIYNGHGFGLVNCKGIIDKYRKTSSIFSESIISAESRSGKGSRFYFRLPLGIKRAMMVVIMFLVTLGGMASPKVPDKNLDFAARYVDSMRTCNIRHDYHRTLMYADTACHYLNAHYLSINKGSKVLMKMMGNTSLTAPEIKWYRDSVRLNYDVVLNLRNESAIAALALNLWDVYEYNNKLCVSLFHEISADNNLPAYCRDMQMKQTNKNIAIVILLCFLVLVLPAYYMVYYRHRLYYRFCIDRIKSINEILESEDDPEVKLKKITDIENAQTRLPEEMESLAQRITEALNKSIAISKAQSDSIEMADDELKRSEYENNLLHVSNSVLDNSLSTLKHETMYYPNRIKQLADVDDVDVNAILEVADYYRNIYMMLSSQLMRQTEYVKFHLENVRMHDADLFGDADLLRYLFDILTHQLNGEITKVDSSVKNYVSFSVAVKNIKLTPEECENLFVPNKNNINMLICKQIVRDHSEFTNLRGCGISAQPDVGNESGIIINVTIPQARKWKNLK